MANPTIPITEDVYSAFVNIIEKEMGLQVVREREGKEIASGNVVVSLERIDAFSLNDIRYYYVIYYYIDIFHTYEQSCAVTRWFVETFLKRLSMGKNNLGGHEMTYFAGNLIVDVPNSRTEGVKILIGLNKVL